ncbi:MAG: ATP-binding protein [Parabacteroides sp.]|nr:ATP-binding protein [Parabacteroides sp.]
MTTNNEINEYEIADYKKQKISDYAGNPLIEALPPIIENDEDVIDAFYNLPLISDEEKRLSPRLKSHILWRVKSFLQPLPEHIRLESIVSILIRNSYKSRNPFDIQTKRKIQVLNKIRNIDNCTADDIENAYQGFTTTAECALITGVSGAGKTTAIDRTLRLNPQVIRHETYKGNLLTRTQIVWLKVDCPFDGNFATLCRSVFQEIDRLTGERWLEKYGYLTHSPSTMIMHLTTLLTNYNVGVLVIDEIQHLSKLKNDGVDMLDFFVTLTNVFSVPIVFIGTSTAKSLFQKNFRLARRIESGGYIEMGPLKKESFEWIIFLESLWDFNVLEEETDLNENIKNVFYDQCQGVIAIAVLLFMCSQSRALLNQMKKLTPEIIREASETDLKLTQPMIIALRSGDPLKIAEFDDIQINEEDIWKNLQHDMDMEERIKDAITAKREEMKTKRQNSHDTLYFNICSSNLFPYLKQDEIRTILDTVINSCDIGTAEDDLKMLVMERIFAENQKKQQKKKVEKVVSIKSSGKLLPIYDDAIKKKEHPHNAFKKTGDIKNPFEEFKQAE